MLIVEESEIFCDYMHISIHTPSATGGIMTKYDFVIHGRIAQYMSLNRQVFAGAG